MKKQYIISIIILVIVVIAIGYFALNTVADNSINVGSAHFKLPDGYQVDNNNTQEGVVVITNGSNKIYLSTCEGKYASRHINSYLNQTAENNQTASNSTLNINDLLVYRYFNNNRKSTNYWFVYNDQVYTIYNWVYDPNFDGVAVELINSIN